MDKIRRREKYNFHNDNSERKWVFILNHSNLGNVMLVEVSKGMTVNKMLLYFFEDNVLHVPKVMEQVLKFKFKSCYQHGFELAMMDLLKKISNIE
mmetsp:Transcript_9359/g.13284  ORF Transcript_9359/g.13284 Transcript_9359/m.13284 type:complete len:95 (+) Transcript_9359:71-355(+)